MLDDVRIRLLGPVGGSTDAGAFDAGPPRQQAVLAMLAARAPQVVPIPDLIDGLWGGEPPRSAEQSIYTYVAGLRRALESVRGPGERPSIVVGVSRGYQLRLDPRQIDARLLAMRVQEARLLQDKGRHADALPLMEQALALSQGSPLGGVPGPFADAERTRLTDLQAIAIERWAEALIHLGRPEEALPRLQETLAHHPLRERARELSMLALSNSGRQAEALDLFAAGQRILADELGADPGEGLRKTHELILRGSSVPLPDVPQQLPRRLSGFVGRVAEVTRLTTLLTPQDAPHPFVAICGPPGVGKSALAVHVAHEVRTQFPDGQLFVNLRGATPGVARLSALDVLSRFLRALGVAGQDDPSDLDEAAAVWRSRIHGKRLLILLDDAADLAQVEPLLTAPLGSSVLVTSRESLIAGDDCEQLILPRLSSNEAAMMLAELAGAERIAEHSADTKLVIEACDGFPLALRIAGARLAERPDWTMSALADRLCDERTRLHELQAGTVAVQSSLASSWISLRDSTRARDTIAARMLALLGVLHLPDITDQTAAALLDDSPSTARRALDRLAEAHLIEVGRGYRYQMHDLIRLFAAGLQPDGGRDAVVRALSFMIVSTRRASTLMDPHRVLAPAPELNATAAPMTDAKQGYDWLIAEEANLTAAAGQAMSDADSDIARLGVVLAFSLFWFHHGAYRMSDPLMLNQHALEVATQLDDKVLACHAHSHLAFFRAEQSRFTEATEHREAELALARQTDDSFSEMRALGNLAHLHIVWEKHELALRYAGDQYEIANAHDIRVGKRYALMKQGEALTGLGRNAEAVAALTSALASAGEDGDLTHQAANRMLLGELCLEDQRHLEAVDHLREALSLQRAVHFQSGEIRCLIRLSKAFRLLGRPSDSLEHIEQAMPLAVTSVSESWQRQALVERAAVYEALGVPVVDRA